MDKKDLLARERDEQYLKVKSLIKKLEYARNLLHLIEERYRKEKRTYEKIDRQLAMIDGRLKVLSPSDVRKKKEKEKSKMAKICENLTVSQIDAIAEKLGISLKKGGE